MEPTISTSQSLTTSQYSKIPIQRDSLIPSPTSSRVLPLDKTLKVCTQSQMTTPPVEPPKLHRTRVKLTDSDRNSVLLSSPSHHEPSPSLNSPHQLSPTINSPTTNQNSQRQSRKRSRTIPVCRTRSYKRSRISIGQRSVSPPIDTHGRSNLNIQQNLNDSSNNLMNDLKDSFKTINNHRFLIESQYNQITEQCEKLRINLNDS